MAIAAGFMTILPDTALVDATASMVPRSSTSSTITATTMTALVNQIVYASPTVETAKSYQFVVFGLTQPSCLLHLANIFIARGKILFIE